MKWHQSFRTKLILTFFPMVAAVVIAAVWFSERRFSRLQQEVFNQQFQESIASFDESRTRRFEALSASLSELAALPAVRTALESGSQNDLRSLVLPRVQDLGGRQLESEGQSPARPAKGSNLTRGNLASTLQKLPLVALVDEKGSITASFGSIDSQPLPRGDISDAIRQAFRKHTRERSEQFLRLNGRTLEEVLTGQQVGYVLSHADNDQPDSVREVFVTPVRDAAGEKFLGALVLGLPLPAAAEQALYRQTRQSNDTPVMSGILIDGQLTSNTIPPSQRPLIANLVQDRIAEGALEGDALIVPLDGVRHRVIFRRLNPDSPFPHAIQVNLYSLARLDAEIAELRTIAAEITGIALLVSLGLIAFVSRGLSGPIGQLTRAVTEIGRGHLDTRVPVLHRDEIGTLSTAFNQMAADLALQDKYRTMLDAVADPAVARRLMEDSAALSGEQREVTMLFCDIRGFTALTEQMDPAVLIDLLNHHMSAMTEEAYTHGGTVDKFVGDLILVLFGAPMDHGPDTAAAAVRCALDMQARRHRMNETAEHPLAVGIGIATGRVVAGCMGSDRRLNYTVLGHRVNLASRLCSLAAAGQVVVDDATLAQLPPGTTSSPLQPARLKGISEPVVCHLIHTLPPT